MRLPKSIVQRIEHLQGSHQTHLDVVKQIMEADSRRMFGVDLIVIAVIQRSFALMDGFTSMVKQRNVLCANALLRLQVDSVMRLYACWLVDDPHSLVNPLLAGKPLKTVKSQNGRSLTDAYLKTEVSKLYPWIRRVYDKTSGFIHLSTPHMFAPVTSIDEVSREMLMSIGVKPGRRWSEEDMIESIDAFTKATKCVLHLAASWLETKKNVATERYGLVDQR